MFSHAVNFNENNFKTPHSPREVFCHRDMRIGYITVLTLSPRQGMAILERYVTVCAHQCVYSVEFTRCQSGGGGYFPSFFSPGHYPGDFVLEAVVGSLARIEENCHVCIKELFYVVFLS